MSVMYMQFICEIPIRQLLLKTLLNSLTLLCVKYTNIHGLFLQIFPSEQSFPVPLKCPFSSGWYTAKFRTENVSFVVHFMQCFCLSIGSWLFLNYNKDSHIMFLFNKVRISKL